MTAAECDPRINAMARAMFIACNHSPIAGEIWDNTSHSGASGTDHYWMLARAALLAADAASPAKIEHSGEGKNSENLSSVSAAPASGGVDGPLAALRCISQRASYGDPGNALADIRRWADAALASPSPSVTEEEIILAMRAAGFSSKEIRAVTYTSWKDGIDIERPSTALVKFVAIIRGERRT